MTAKDDLANILADALNNKSTEGNVAFFLDDDSVPTNPHGWVSTGQSILDLAISNRPYGGIPVGRIVEITGLEQTGKSLVAAHILSETQKQGGVAVLIDTENAVNRDFYEAIGLDISKLLYIQADTVEQVFEYIERIIEKIRLSTKDRLVTIVVDSVAAASTKREIESDYDKDGYATDKAIIISKALRKITNHLGRQKISLIFTNQLRVKIGAMAFADPWTTSGGKALGFHSSIRIRLKNLGKIKKGEEIIGIKIRAHIIKNRMGPPQRFADFDIYFNSGIDNYGSWLSVLKTNKILKQTGAWYTYTDEKSEEHKFQSKDFQEFLDSSPELKSELYDKICEAVILKYKKNNLDVIDEVEVTQETDE